MKKLLFILMILLAPIVGAQTIEESVVVEALIEQQTPTLFDLKPANMRKYIGKVTREDFEKIVGEELGRDSSGRSIYNVEVSRSDVGHTAIYCLYRQIDDKLIGVEFGTPHNFSYWLAFINLEGYIKGSSKRYEDAYGNEIRSDLKVGNFGMQILDIVTTPHYSTARINYHIIK